MSQSAHRLLECVAKRYRCALKLQVNNASASEQKSIVTTRGNDALLDVVSKLIVACQNYGKFMCGHVSTAFLMRFAKSSGCLGVLQIDI